MSRLKYFGAAVMVTALALVTAHGYLLQNSFFDETIVWDDGLGWERFGDGPPVTQEDWASGSPGEFGQFGVEGDGNLGVAQRCDYSSGGGIVQVVPGIVPGAEYYLEIHSHAGSGSAAGDAWPTTSVFNIDFEWFVGHPDTVGSNLSTSATIIDPKDGGSDGGFPPGYSEPDNWDYWFITNTAPALATHMRLTIKWDGGEVSTSESAAVRWDNALLTTSAVDPLNVTQGIDDAMQMSFNTQSAVTYNVESTTDLVVDFSDAGLPEVVGDSTTQELFFLSGEDMDFFRLKAVDFPLLPDFTVRPYDPSGDGDWLGWMNVSELPANGGGHLWGSAWGLDDLVSDMTSCTNGGSTVLTLKVNSIDDPAEYWYIGGGGPGNPGNKVMEANLYLESSNPSLVGETVTFSGTVLANSLSNTHSVVAFIKDFTPDYSSNVAVTNSLPPGPFSLSLDTIDDPGRHIQFGFALTGPCVWITDADLFGHVQLAVEPSVAGELDDTHMGFDLTLGVVVSWDGQLGVHFQPEYSDDMGGTWLPLGPTLLGDGTAMRVTDPEGAVSGRTYRILRTPTATPPPST